MNKLPLGYKQTEVGVIPEDWEVKTLGNVLTLQRGYDLPHRLRHAGSIPIVSSSGVCDMHDEARASAPGVVTGRYGTIGEVYFIDQSYWPLNTTLFVKNFKGNDPLFVSYQLRTIDFQSHSGKSGVPGVNRNDLHELIVAHPPLPEQEAIAEALSDADALIESLEQLITKKRHLKQGAMQELLTGKRRLPGFAPVGAGFKPALRDDADIGGIADIERAGLKPAPTDVPHGWEVSTFGDVFNITAGGDVDPKRTISYQDQTHCYPIYSNSLTDYGLYGYCSYADHQAGSITVTARGTLGFANFRDHAFTAIGRVLVLQSKQLSDGRFFAEFINNRIKFAIESTGVPQLTAPQISTYRLSAPPLPEQTVIATILSDMDTEITALETKLAKTRALKQGMMHNLLTGRIRLL